MQERASAFLIPEDPLPGLDDLSNEGFREVIVPGCRKDAALFISPSDEPNGYEHPFRNVSLKVVAAAQGGCFAYARRLGRLQTRLYRSRYRGDWKVVLPDLRAALADAPPNVGAALA